MGWTDDEAGAASARLIAFPKTWISGYPFCIWLGSPAWAIMRGFVLRYFDNSLAYDRAWELLANKVLFGGHANELRWCPRDPGEWR